MLKKYSKFVLFNSRLLLLCYMSLLLRHNLIKAFPSVRKFFPLEIIWAAVIVGILIAFYAFYLVIKSELTGKFSKMVKWFFVIDILSIPIDIFYVWYQRKNLLVFLNPHQSIIQLCIIFFILNITHFCISISLRRKIRASKNQT